MHVLFLLIRIKGKEDVMQICVQVHWSVMDVSFYQEICGILKKKNEEHAIWFTLERVQPSIQKCSLIFQVVVVVESMALCWRTSNAIQFCLNIGLY